MNTKILKDKAEIVKESISRVEEELGDSLDSLNNITKREAVIYNMLRACEACIAAAMLLVSQNNMGIPQSSGEAFELLEYHNVIDEEMAKKLKYMVEFRDAAVHDFHVPENALLQLYIDNLEQLNAFMEHVSEDDNEN